MKTLWRLLGLFRPYRGWLALGIALALITVLANVALLAIAGWFITAMALAGVAGASMNYFTPAALIRAMAILRTTGRYAERLVTHEATFRVLAELRVWFYQRLEPLAPAGLEAFRSGDLLSRLRADIDTLDKVYLRLLLPVVVAVLAAGVVVAVLAGYGTGLALAEAVLLGVAGVLVPWAVQRFARRAGQAQVETAAALRAQLVNDLQGMGELLVYGAAPVHEARLRALSAQLAGAQRRLSGLQGMSQAALGLCANLALWAMVILAAPLLMAQRIAPADLVMLALFALAAFEAVAPLPLALQSLGEILAAARRIFSVVDRPPPVREPAQPRAMPAQFDFQLQAVHLRYRARGEEALRGVDLDWRPGEQLALVGESGSGKSSLVNLLLRFRAPDSGCILLDGEALERYEGDTLRAQIAVAAQQVHLFNASIRDNLRLARPDAGQAAIEAACRTALIHDFITQQPDGYDTVVGETGVRLSGGQARRLVVARALLKAAPVLILDEPTEGLDPETADRLLHNVRDQATVHGQSLLLITHRLAGLEAMDRILIMAGGRIVEAGSHAELLAQRGRYHHVLSSGLR